jgi:DNA-binding SARP family transcriptional activator
MEYQLAQQDSTGASGAAVRMTLTGEFELVVAGRRVALPHSVERVLAYLALIEHPVSRTKLAGALWFDASEQRAGNNLRTTLWRLGRAGAPILMSDTERLGLSSDVRVDVTELRELSRRLIHEPDVDDLCRLPVLVEGAELLPDWDDAWVVADRERFRLLRLEALERAASALIAQRQLGDALVAALASVQSDPLRESGRRLVIAVHVSEGNGAEALRSYREFRALLWGELGIEPSRLMQQLIEPLGSDPRMPVT